MILTSSSMLYDDRAREFRMLRIAVVFILLKFVAYGDPQCNVYKSDATFFQANRAASRPYDLCESDFAVNNESHSYPSLQCNENGTKRLDVNVSQFVGRPYRNRAERVGL